MKVWIALVLGLFWTSMGWAADLGYEDDLAPGYLECIKQNKSMAQDRTCLWNAVAYWQQQIREESDKLLDSITIPASKAKFKELITNWDNYLHNVTATASASGGNEFAALTTINLSRKHFLFLKQLWESDLVRKYE